jgi:hypothetical protein
MPGCGWAPGFFVAQGAELFIFELVKLFINT